MDTIRYSLVFLIFIFSFTTEAKHADVDDVVWQQRAKEAKIAARQAYRPDPWTVSDDLNNRVHQ